MKIHVNRIPAEGRREEAQFDPETLEINRADVQLKGPVTVSAMLTRGAQQLVVQADIGAQLALTCARCLEGFETPLQTQAIFTYRVGSSDVVDITNDVRQELVLAYPMIPHCRETCKGLCPECGQNLNHAACQHQVAQ